MHYKKYILLLILFPLSLWGQSITQLQFRNQPIRDILMVLAEVSGQSIIADETVSGQTTYFFNDMDLESALDQFLTHNGYFYEKRNNTYHVSRIKTRNDNGTITFQAEDTDLQHVIRHLSRDLGITILHDALPRETVTINYQNGNLKNLLEIILKPYSQFYLETGDNYFYLRKKSVNSPSRTGGGSDLFNKKDDYYSSEFEQIRFREALGNLMSQEGKEYAFLGRNDDIIEFFNHRDKSFGEILNLLMEQGNSTYQISGDIYYIMDLDRQDILKQYFTTLYIPLENISVDRFNSLLPSSLGSSSLIKSDRDNNAVLLNGTLMELAPIEAFIQDIDKPFTDREYRRYELQYITVEEFQKRLSPDFSGVPLLSVGEKAFLAPLTQEKHAALLEYLALTDRNASTYPVTLSYLKWDDLKDNLPPHVESEQLHPTGDPTLLFFQGSEGEWELLKEHLAQMDRPTPQIRYEILVLEVEDSQDLNLDTGLTFKGAEDGVSTGFTGILDGLASMTFDVVNQFGYQFAANLSLELITNRSRVLTDTTLYGLSGEEIKIQNTNTSRHATTTVDADTGDTEVTGFKEITSGLIVSMEGWVSGDGMITMDVESTISSQTSTSGDDSDSIPSTSEKIINTHVRSQSGEPIILSGLKQRKTVTELSKVPILGSIPLIGLLFQDRTETVKNIEFIITLIPYREMDKSTPDEDPYESLYNTFCKRD